MKKLNIGLIGYGFMGRAHSNAFRKVSNFFEVPYEPVLKTICARNAERARSFAETWGYESAETDWRKVVASPEIDLIDIASPNDTHAEIAIAAAKAGKMVLCEKPLGRNAAEAEAMVKAVEAAGVPNMVWYNYRRVPAVTLAKHLIDEGRLGRIFHYRAKFLQDWTISTDLPQGGEGLWRLDVNVAGSGVTGDLLAHCIDTALWLNGPIDEVSAMTETFIKSRKHNLTGRVEPVGIDDASLFLARFQNGSLATFEATRYARGHKALYTFEINGEHASIMWDLHDLHRLQYFDHCDEGPLRGWRNLHIMQIEAKYRVHKEDGHDPPGGPTVPNGRPNGPALASPLPSAAVTYNGRGSGGILRVTQVSRRMSSSAARYEFPSQGGAHEGRRRQGDRARRAARRPGTRGARQAHGGRARDPRRDAAPAPARRSPIRRTPSRRDGRLDGRAVRASPTSILRVQKPTEAEVRRAAQGQAVLGLLQPAHRPEDRRGARRAGRDRDQP